MLLHKGNECLHVTAKICIKGVRTALSFGCTDIVLTAISIAYTQNKMAPVSSKLLLLEEEEKEDKLLLAVEAAATATKRKRWHRW